MDKVPLTIINGFLGAGKTTLLKSLLIQSHRQSLTACVIVNDMSELDVDGVLIANTELVNTSRHNFFSVSADSISSQSGIAKLDDILQQILVHCQPDMILLETSGSSHPLPLVRYLRDHLCVQLKGVFSLVDSVMLNDDFAAGSALIPRLQANLQAGKRKMENLLAEQIMFCSHLILTKNDRLPSDVVKSIALAIHTLNPCVDVMAVQRGNMALDKLLTLPDYDFHRVGLLIDELAEEVGDSMSTESANWAMKAEVLKDDRPFHPQRLWNACHQFMGTGVYRSKGFFWLPGRDDLALLWNQASGSISLEFISYWKAGILHHTDNHLTAEERLILQQEVDNTVGRFGDRHCSLTVIGEEEAVSAFARALKECLLTEDEIAWWRTGGTFVDPWPQRIARVTI